MLALVQYSQPQEPSGWLAGSWVNAHQQPYCLQGCHIVPASRVGAAEPSNLVLLCDHCPSSSRMSPIHRGVGCSGALPGISATCTY